MCTNTLQNACAHQQVGPFKWQSCQLLSSNGPTQALPLCLTLHLNLCHCDIIAYLLRIFWDLKTYIQELVSPDHWLKQSCAYYFAPALSFKLLHRALPLFLTSSTSNYSLVVLTLPSCLFCLIRWYNFDFLSKSIHFYVHFPICLSVYLSVYLSIHPSVCLSDCLLI